MICQIIYYNSFEYKILSNNKSLKQKLALVLEQDDEGTYQTDLEPSLGCKRLVKVEFEFLVVYKCSLIKIPVNTINVPVSFRQ